MSEPPGEPRPVLVVHGVATRDRDVYEGDVEALGRALGPGVRLVPVYWGDFAPPDEALDAALPYLGWSAKEGLRSARHRLLGEVYTLFREQYLRASARFTADLILYHYRQAELHALVWEAIMRDLPGHGLPEKPVDVITHSLGGTMVFDMAVAGRPRLHIANLMSCASQMSYFHAIGASSLEPRGRPRHGHDSGPVTLPAGIGSWTNFFVPLDPWAYLAAPVFRMADGGEPTDVEVYAGAFSDRILTHAAAHYWTHPVVIDTIKRQLGL